MLFLCHNGKIKFSLHSGEPQFDAHMSQVQWNLPFDVRLIGGHLQEVVAYGTEVIIQGGSTHVSCKILLNLDLAILA